MQTVRDLKVEICRKKATIPINPNPLMAAAFKRAHSEMCPEVDWYWRWRITGTEEEMLSDLVLKMAEKTIVNKAFEKADAKLPEKVKKTARAMIIKQLNTIINTAVRPSWRGLVNQIQDRQATL